MISSIICNNPNVPSNSYPCFRTLLRIFRCEYNYPLITPDSPRPSHHKQDSPALPSFLSNRNLLSPAFRFLFPIIILCPVCRIYMHAFTYQRIHYDVTPQKNIHEYGNAQTNIYFFDFMLSKFSFLFLVNYTVTYALGYS